MSRPFQDPAWARIFQEREWGKYPCEDLVRWVCRTHPNKASRAAIRILDVGCGAGANLQMLAAEGFSVTGLDGAPGALEAVRRLMKDRFVATLVLSDMADMPFGNGEFDVVVDVASVQQHRVAQIALILAEIRRVLKPGGRFFSKMVAEGSWGDGTGAQLEPGTFTGIPEGPFAGLGTTHFTRETQLAGFLAGFESLKIEYEARTLESQQRLIKHFIIEGRV